MEELKINQKKCEVNKRRLVLDFSLEGNNYRYTHDHWDWEKDATNEFLLDGKQRQYLDGLVNREDWPFLTVMDAYKHNLQVALHRVGSDENTLFIDRRYCHNNSYDVYFQGKHYLVGSEILPTNK